VNLRMLYTIFDPSSPMFYISYSETSIVCLNVNILSSPVCRGKDVILFCLLFGSLCVSTQ